MPVNCADFQKDIDKDYSYTKEQVKRAVEAQNERYKNTPYFFNADIIRLGAKEELTRAIFKYFPYCDNARDAFILYSLSRTLADLDGNEEIKDDDIQKAKLLWQNDPENIFL